MPDDLTFCFPLSCKIFLKNPVIVYSAFQGTVHPFIEVSFQRTVYQTNTASGSHPCWNEEIKVDFM